MIQVLGFILSLDLGFLCIRGSCFVCIRGFCRCIRRRPGRRDGIVGRQGLARIGRIAAQIDGIAQFGSHITAQDLGVGKINGGVRIGIHLVVIAKDGHIFDIVGLAVIGALALHHVVGTHNGDLAQGIGMDGGTACSAIDGIAAALHDDILHHIVFDILVQGVAAASHVHAGQRIGGILIRYGSDRILIPGNTALDDGAPVTADGIAAAQSIHIAAGHRIVLADGGGIGAVGLAAFAHSHGIGAGSQRFAANGRAVIVFHRGIVPQSHALVAGCGGKVANGYRACTGFAGGIGGIGLGTGPDGDGIICLGRSRCTESDTVLPIGRCIVCCRRSSSILRRVRCRADGNAAKAPRIHVIAYRQALYIGGTGVGTDGHGIGLSGSGPRIVLVHRLVFTGGADGEIMGLGSIHRCIQSGKFVIKISPCEPHFRIRSLEQFIQGIQLPHSGRIGIEHAICHIGDAPRQGAVAYRDVMRVCLERFIGKG